MTSKAIRIVKASETKAVYRSGPPSPRKITREVVRQLRESGASGDLVDYAKKHAERSEG